ncbi:MAG TPA: hypothetical protein PK286_10605 [Devosia sp.]|nr:hypothetical protein [Devosia sp.]
MNKPTGNRPIAIEVDGEPLGVVIPEGEAFRFLAVRLNAFGIDGQIFSSVEAAEEAASIALGKAE